MNVVIISFRWWFWHIWSNMTSTRANRGVWRSKRSLLASTMQLWRYKVVSSILSKKKVKHYDASLSATTFWHFVFLKKKKFHHQPNPNSILANFYTISLYFQYVFHVLWVPELSLISLTCGWKVKVLFSSLDFLIFSFCSLKFYENLNLFQCNLWFNSEYYWFIVICWMHENVWL